MKRIVTLSMAILMIACLLAACTSAPVFTPTGTTASSSNAATTAPTSTADQSTTAPTAAPDASSTAPSTGDAPAQPVEKNFEIPEGGYDGSEVTITLNLQGSYRQREILNEYISQFNALYPNIHIVLQESTNVGELFNDTRDDLATGKQVNISLCRPEHLPYYQQSGKLVALDNLIQSQIPVSHADGTREILGLTDSQKSDFLPSFYERGRQMGDGKMYSLPFSLSGEVLYYNKTFFDEHDLTVPTTWEELWALCAQIKQIDPNCIPLGYDNDDNMFITQCMQNGYGYTSAAGEEKLLFDNADTRAFVADMRSYYEQGYFTTKSILGYYTTTLFATNDTVKCYMSIGSHAGASHYRMRDDIDGEWVDVHEVGIAPVPHAANGQALAASLGNDLCIFDSENPQEVIASWLFVKFLTTDPEFQADYSMAFDWLPVIQSAIDLPRYRRYLQCADTTTNVRALAVQVALTQSYYNTPIFDGCDTVRSEIINLMTQALSQRTTDMDKLIDELFKKAYNNCNSTVS